MLAALPAAAVDCACEFEDADPEVDPLAEPAPDCDVDTMLEFEGAAIFRG